ncbi:MAG: hypothetical protein M4D80_38660 [Myxococcota bacterium]|nr:hypothetical protein [Myxococcota bacterium]
MTCISTPVSWLRLEQFAANRADAQIASHVAECPACAHCLDEIRGDVVALPPLAVPERRARPWWHFAVPALALAAAALLFVVWPREAQRDDLVRVKGVGDVVLGIVRERDGVIRDDATTFREGDRFKIVLTCPPAASAWIDVDVGGDHPLPASQISCGNKVVVPGAFHLTGTAPNRICVRVAPDAAPGTDAPRACLTVRPE